MERPTHPRDLDPGLARHAQVEDRDGRLAQLDLLDRVVAVAGTTGDLDPVLGEHVGDRLDDRRMVVGDEHGCRRPRPVTGIYDPFAGKRPVVGEHERSAAAHQKLRIGAALRDGIIETVTYDTEETLRARHAGPPDPRRAARALESSRRAPGLGRARARRRGAGDEAPRPDRADAEHRRRGRRDRARAAGLRPAPVAAADGALRGCCGGRCGGARRARAADTRRGAA